MVGLLVNLDFACCSCNEPIGVTVHCEGKGLTDRRRPVAAFNVECPHCDERNRVYFETNGTVCRVGPSPEPHLLLEPSIN